MTWFFLKTDYNIYTAIITTFEPSQQVYLDIWLTAKTEIESHYNKQVNEKMIKTKENPNIYYSHLYTLLKLLLKLNYLLRISFFNLNNYNLCHWISNY